MENKVKVQLYASVEDDGQKVGKVVICFDEDVELGNVDLDTFVVHGKHTVDRIDIEDHMSFGEYDDDRTIVKVEVDGQVVTLYLDLAEGGTMSYLHPAGRNFPMTINYTVKQVKPMNGKIYDYEVLPNIIDEEIEQFESVIVEDGINYQFYNAGEDADSLIVWFHGNGEGDFKFSNNNIAQIAGNRGGVAWTTKEAQNIFGKAHVMAFQAPDTWYYAQRDNLLGKAMKEINELYEKYHFDWNKMYIAGCSAGGYMTTRMLLAYPDTFKAAMITCPALDVATKRGGETPSNEELKTLTYSSTPIWLVQGVTDNVVQTKECAQRMFNCLCGEETIAVRRYDQDIQSGFVTYETCDGKYKLTLYDTTKDHKLVFALDQNQDSVQEEVQFIDHWSWIYTLRNNPKDVNGVSIWQWAANTKKHLIDLHIEK